MNTSLIIIWWLVEWAVGAPHAHLGGDKSVDEPGVTSDPTAVIFDEETLRFLRRLALRKPIQKARNYPQDNWWSRGGRSGERYSDGNQLKERDAEAIVFPDDLQLGRYPSRNRLVGRDPDAIFFPDRLHPLDKLPVQSQTHSTFFANRGGEDDVVISYPGEYIRKTPGLEQEGVGFGAEEGARPSEGEDTLYHKFENVTDTAEDNAHGKVHSTFLDNRGGEDDVVISYPGEYTRKTAGLEQGGAGEGAKPSEGEDDRSSNNSTGTGEDAVHGNVSPPDAEEGVVIFHLEEYLRKKEDLDKKTEVSVTEASSTEESSELPGVVDTVSEDAKNISEHSVDSINRTVPSPDEKDTEDYDFIVSYPEDMLREMPDFDQDSSALGTGEGIKSSEGEAIQYSESKNLTDTAEDTTLRKCDSGSKCESGTLLTDDRSRIVFEDEARRAEASNSSAPLQLPPRTARSPAGLYSRSPSP